MPYTFEIDDPSGHSNIKNMMAPLADPMLSISKYVRTVEQITAMGYNPENVKCDTEAEVIEAIEETKMKKEETPITTESNKELDSKKHNYTEKETTELITKMEETITEKKEAEPPLDIQGMNFNEPLDDNIARAKDLKQESISFETPCHNCFAEGVTRMCTCEIPFFKEIIVMAFTCDKCGARSSEVKTGGGVSDLGKKMTFYVDGVEDMNRDIFKSETAEVSINELGLTITQGSLGGLYSTVEGLFAKMIETLRGNNPFMGDSADKDFVNRFEGFIDKLEKYQDGKEKFTLIVDDPMNNCWIANPNHPNEDPKVVVVEYERTEEQNIEFGVNFLIEMEREREEAEKKNANAKDIEN